MKPFLVLIVVFVISLFSIKVINGKYDFMLSGRIAMSTMLLFTALGHFLFSDGMALMVPDKIPFKKGIIYFTAILEILGAIGLHIPQLRLLTAWLLILFFIIILPANIKASIDHLNYQKATYDGHGLMYLWFRAPLQLLFIIWIYLTAIKFK